MSEGFKIEVEPLRSRLLYICTPAYGGNVTNVNSQCQLGLQELLMKCGITSQVVTIANESLITRARNKMAATFLSSNYSDLLFIDADIEFKPEDVISLMHFAQGDIEVIGGAYPLKAINWQAVKDAVKKNPDIDPKDLEKMGAMYASHAFDGEVDLPPFTPIEAKELATGFMLIKRQALEKLEPHCERYTPYSIEGMQEKEIIDFFPAKVFGSEYLSEDYAFCRKFREIGGKIHLAPWINLTHYGMYGFKGDMNKSAELLGVIH